MSEKSLSTNFLLVKNFVPGTQRVAQNQKNMAKCREFDHSEEMSGSNLTGEKTTHVTVTSYPW